MGMAVSIDVRDDAGDGDDHVRVWPRSSTGCTTSIDLQPYIDDSPISRLGRAEITLDDVSDEVCRRAAALRAADRDDTGGAFDAFAVPAPNGTIARPVRRT